MKDSTNKKFKVMGILLLVVVAFFMGKTTTSSKIDVYEHTDTHIEETVWTCSMHPQIKLPKPGKCPLCAMDLIPLEKDDMVGETGEPQIRLSEYSRKLASVRTARVQKATKNSTLELVGELVWDETKLKTETAWFGGRIEKLNVSFTGQYVKKGQVIAEIYSPELYAAAEEWRQSKGSDNDRLKQSVHKKLKLLGLDDDDIKNLSTINSERVIQRAKYSGVVVRRSVEEGQYVKIGSPLVKLGSTRSLWVELDVFEQDLPGIRIGQKVMLKTESLPGEEFKSTVGFIHPVLDKMNRAVKVRLSVANRKTMLKPGMLVRGNISVKGLTEKLLIPESAPLLTGERAVVYLEIEPGVYTGRVIVLGEHVGAYYEVLKGLQENDVIVARGAFKIDAAMQIQALPSVMYPKGGGLADAHKHNAIVKQQSKSGDEKNALNKGILDSKGSKWLETYFSSYIKLQKALVADDVEKAKASILSLAAQLHSIPKILNDGHTKHKAAGFKASAESGDINSIRSEFLTLSTALIQWLRSTELKPGKGAAIYFCPMANKNNGAEWLQQGGDVQNPYYGSAMLECGEQRLVLSKPEEDK
ncbi:MAG: efflux RND transporter periplasmic adaptor subunit [Fibrobacterales bacterium]